MPERNEPWPYVHALATRAPPMQATSPAGPAAAQGCCRRSACIPTTRDVDRFDLTGARALVVATNHGALDIGKPTGVFASEMTVPYYAFLDAGMDVDVASPNGGVIPVDPQSLKPVVRTAEDDRFLADDDFRGKVTDSLAIGELDMADYDIVFLAGGWGAAFDFGFSEALGGKITEANAAGKVIGGVCHGPLGLLNAHGADGAPAGRGPQVTGGDRQAGQRARDRVDPAPSRDRAAPAGCRVRERVSVPGSVRQPLGRRRQPRHRPEPERRADGGPRDDATLSIRRSQGALQWLTRPRYGQIDRDYGMQAGHHVGRRRRSDLDGQPDEVPRDVADYADGRETTISGRQADDLYAPLDVLAEIGAEIVFAADVEQQLLGESPIWDRVAIVKYPTRRSFIEMQSRPDFQDKHVHKEAGMEFTIVSRLPPDRGSGGVDTVDWSQVPHPPTADDGPVVVIHVLKFDDASAADVTPDEMVAYQQAAAGGRRAARCADQRVVRRRGHDPR